MSYRRHVNELIPTRDLEFLLYEWLDVVSLTRHPLFSQHDRATFDDVLAAARTLALEAFLPHAAKADANEPRFDGQRVHLIPEVKAALQAFIEAGFLGASFPADDGGLGLPYTLTAAFGAQFVAANAGTTGYAFLTSAAANLLRVHGSAQQKARFMRPMLEGRFFGTMCLSEPEAGSSLADIRTRAIPQPDGTYQVVGNKMWISSGEHDLSETIVHLVLARIEGAPAGVKGISLFVVPKHRVREDGVVGATNGVTLAGLNHKMGYRGNTNCALNFGEREPAVGELVGQANQGLALMFHMMNEARIGVGLGATALGFAGYRYSVEYARTRLQGRKVSNKDPASKPVAIIEHADVRRMLLAQKSYVEGGLALGLYCAKLVDEMAATADAKTRAELTLLLDILTPIAKAWPSEWCLEANKLAIQVLGGYGYTRDYPVERLYRDNRLNAIHEGTNGIQALDLLGRKVTMQNGAALALLLGRIHDTCTSASAVASLAEPARELAFAATRVMLTTQALGAVALEGKVELFLANASAYLDMLGHVVIAWLWLEQAMVAERSVSAATDKDFYTGKLAACRYFFRYELPKAERAAELLNRMDDTVLTMPIAAF